MWIGYINVYYIIKVLNSSVLEYGITELFLCKNIYMLLNECSFYVPLLFYRFNKQVYQCLLEN